MTDCGFCDLPTSKCECDICDGCENLTEDCTCCPDCEYPQDECVCCNECGEVLDNCECETDD